MDELVVEVLVSVVIVVKVVGVGVIRHEQADDTREAGYCET